MTLSHHASRAGDPRRVDRIALMGVKPAGGFGRGVYHDLDVRQRLRRKTAPEIRRHAFMGPVCIGPATNRANPFERATDLCAEKATGAGDGYPRRRGDPLQSRPRHGRVGCGLNPIDQLLEHRGHPEEMLRCHWRPPFSRDRLIKRFNQGRQTRIRDACAKTPAQADRGSRGELPRFDGGIQDFFQRLRPRVRCPNHDRTYRVAGQRPLSSDDGQYQAIGRDRRLTDSRPTTSPARTAAWRSPGPAWAHAISIGTPAELPRSRT